MKKVIFFVAILLLTLNLTSQVEEDTGYIVKIGDKAPNFTLNFIDGKQQTLNDLKGNVVVLQFTASWCSVCRKEMPHLEKEVWLPNKNKNFILIGIDYDEPLEKVKAFKEKMKITYPMALDPNADIFALYAKKRSGVTRNVVIDQNGNIAFLTRLYDRKEFEAMKKKIEELLSE